MEEEMTFEASWPELQRQLRDALSRRKVPTDFREDVLQETALRLLRNWDRVRPESMWAFALTVALNIVRDEARRKERRDRTVLENPAVDRDPEHEAIVRLELDRVREALASMTERQRTILLSEVGEATIAEGSTPSVKMARMRARRRLRALIEGVSGYAALPLIRTRQWLQGTDIGVANTAASLAVQIAAFIALSGAGFPTLDAPPGRTTQRAPVGTHTATAAQPWASSSPSRTDQTSRLSMLSPTFATRHMQPVRRDEREGRDLNEHFGFVHKDGDSVVVGDDAQVGPYGASHTVAQTVAGSTVVAAVKARYDSAECVNEFLESRHSACANPGSGRGRLRTAVMNEQHTAGFGTGRAN